MSQALPPIPVANLSATVASYRDILVDLADERAREPLVKYADYGIACESFYARTDGGNWPYNEAIAGATRDVWGRKALAEKLVSVNHALAASGCELIVLDGYRSIACQQGLWNFFMRQAQRDMPEATSEAKLAFVRTYVSDPTRFRADDSRTWPSHSTGGAVDMMLRDKRTAKLLDMGARFDEMTPLSATAYFEQELQAGNISAQDPRLLNRRRLYAAMISAGFSNYAHEFWHYDYGDQMYGMYSGATAWYGYIESPESPT